MSPPSASSHPSIPVNSLPAEAGSSLHPPLPTSSHPSLPVNTLPAAAGSILPPAEPAINARVELTEFGFQVSEDLQLFVERHKGVKLCAKQLMPDHLHVVLWVFKDSDKSIKELAHGFRKGITNIAVALGVWGKDGAYQPLLKTGTPTTTNPSLHPSPSASASPSPSPVPASSHPPLPVNTLPAEAGSILPSAAAGSILPSSAPATTKRGFVLDQPFIRTLAHRGQLRSMIDYVHSNPFRAMAKRMNPELFTLHRETRIAGLTFSSMGNHWLLDWPVKQMIQCSRTISEASLAARLTTVLTAAESGAVSYTAAISKGEQQIARALREAGHPLVVLLKDGFPPQGSEHERYYKPGGLYFEACMRGRLLLLEPTASSYASPLVVAATEQALKTKALERHQSYIPLPHTVTRWRFMAGNAMLELMITGER